MRIKLISPIGHTTPMLFETFVPYFESKGHEIVNNVNDADICFIDLHSRLFNYDESELRLTLDKKKCVFDFADYGGCIDGTEKFPLEPINQLIDYVGHPSYSNDIWFVRKLSKEDAVKYKNVYPIELCLYPDHIFNEVNKEDLFNRPNDICFIGNTSPTREKVCNELSKYFKCDFVLGQERIPHDQWLNRARQAKMFLTADGGGFSDERPYQLITIAPMLKQKNNQLINNDFTDTINCIKVDEHPTKIQLYYLQNTLNNKERLYSIYMNGIEHMKTYFNFESRAEYILNTIDNIYERNKVRIDFKNR